MKKGKNIILDIAKKLAKTSKGIFQSIAFYPVIICLGFLILSIVTLHYENSEVINFLKKHVPFLITKDLGIAQNILTTMIGGILSLTVFSFSMVMMVLSQASSNFSPRLLPGLVSDRKNQLILGFYTGTILYTIIILMSLGSYKASEDYIGFSTMLSAIFGVSCIIIFIYFIHTISSAIQINNIVDNIFDYSYRKLENTINNQEKCDLNTKNWNLIYSQQSCYYRGFLISFASDYFKKQENKVEILVYQDQYVWEGTPLLKIKDTIPKEELQSLLDCLYFSKERHGGKNYISGMIKLMEVAVRAMSPGINDPGTTINVITKLGKLSGLVFQLYTKSSERNETNKITFIKNNIHPDELIRLIFQPIRQYSKKDASVMYELAKVYLFLKTNGRIQQEAIQVIEKEITNVKNDINQYIENESDKNRILQLFN